METNPHTQSTLERIAEFETEKKTCEKLLLELNDKILQNNKKSRKFFIQTVIHKGGLGAGTPKDDVVELCLVYIHQDTFRSSPWSCHTFIKEESADSIYKSLVLHGEIW